MKKYLFLITFFSAVFFIYSLLLAFLGSARVSIAATQNPKIMLLLPEGETFLQTEPDEDFRYGGRLFVTSKDVAGKRRITIWRPGKNQSDEWLPLRVVQER